MASTIKVNNIQNQCGANIANKCGSTVTLGASGDTITLACGASQTGFGRTGTVDWDTTAKTASFTAVSGNGYFVNTTSGAITVTLPASPSAGDIVAIKDYANTADTNAITIARNGSNIDGTTENPVIANEGGSVTLIYVDATKGWLVTDAAQKSDIRFPEYIVATGGTITTCGDYKIHTFTGPGTFTVCSVGNPIGSTTVDYLVVAGGAGGAKGRGGGGGAGGARASSGAASGCYAAGPIGACVSALPVSVQGYPITIGGGGAGQTYPPACTPIVGNPGSNSIFSSITSTGGGAGIGENTPGPAPSGGSGGGGARNATTGQNGGAGNTPPVSPPQGNAGGNSIPSIGGGGGGGGATAAGSNSTAHPTTGGLGGDGGTGVTSCITGSPVGYAGGGGGGNADSAPNVNLPNAPSVGRGGTGGNAFGQPQIFATAGATNSGGGGGGGGHGCACAGERNSAAGGSGIVIIRYKYQ